MRHTDTSKANGCEVQSGGTLFLYTAIRTVSVLIEKKLKRRVFQSRAAVEGISQSTLWLKVTIFNLSWLLKRITGEDHDWKFNPGDFSMKCEQQWQEVSQIPWA